MLVVSKVNKPMAIGCLTRKKKHNPNRVLRISMAIISWGDMELELIVNLFICVKS